MSVLFRAAAVLAAATGLLACAGGPKPFPAPIPLLEGKARTAFALQVVEVAAGAGALALPAKCFYVHYTGWLVDGKKFDSSHDSTGAGMPREPLGFPQGLGGSFRDGMPASRACGSGGSGG